MTLQQARRLLQQHQDILVGYKLRLSQYGTPTNPHAIDYGWLQGGIRQEKAIIAQLEYEVERLEPVEEKQ